MESGVNATSADDSATRRIAQDHCTDIPHAGFPMEVIQADDVCTSDDVTAFMLIILTRFISKSFSPDFNDGKIIFTASGAKI